MTLGLNYATGEARYHSISCVCYRCRNTDMAMMGRGQPGRVWQVVYCHSPPAYVCPACETLGILTDHPVFDSPKVEDQWHLKYLARMRVET